MSYIARMPDFRRSRASTRRIYKGQHRFEHWYRDNQVYFLTARCRDQFPAFTSEAAKAIFWDRFDHYTQQFGFTPWVTSLLDNHYHAIGYLRLGENLGPMMQRIHGSVAKLVNDVLEDLDVTYPRVAPPGVAASAAMSGSGPDPDPDPDSPRLVPFWKDSNTKNYYDGCLRDEKQGRLTYRYVLTQSRRHGIIRDWRNYPHTHVNVEMEPAIERASQLHAFLKGVPYKRYGDYTRYEHRTRYGHGD